MTLLHAFIDQVIMAIFTFIACYSQRDKLSDSFYTTGIYYLLFSIFIFGTWIRWYLQIPLIGFLKYLF
jgi:hypothetical protein